MGRGGRAGGAPAPPGRGRAPPPRRSSRRWPPPFPRRPALIRGLGRLGPCPPWAKRTPAFQWRWLAGVPPPGRPRPGAESGEDVSHPHFHARSAPLGIPLKSSPARGGRRPRIGGLGREMRGETGMQPLTRGGDRNGGPRPAGAGRGMRGDLTLLLLFFPWFSLQPDQQNAPLHGEGGDRLDGGRALGGGDLGDQGLGDGEGHDGGRRGGCAEEEGRRRGKRCVFSGGGERREKEAFFVLFCPLTRRGVDEWGRREAGVDTHTHTHTHSRARGRAVLSPACVGCVRGVAALLAPFSTPPHACAALAPYGARDPPRDQRGGGGGLVGGHGPRPRRAGRRRGA